jgi:hypothetical protein
MCQMCEEYEAELRRLGIAMDEKHKVEVDFDSDEMAALRVLAAAHGHSVEKEIELIVRQSFRAEIISENG